MSASSPRATPVGLGPRIVQTRARAAGALLSCLLLAAASDGVAEPRPEQAGLAPLAAAPFAPARIPSPGELRKAGWEPAAGELGSEDVTQPRIPLQRGVALLISRPEQLPRPSADFAGQRQPLPLAAVQSLLERRDDGEEAVMAWTPRLRLEHVAPTGWLLDVDVQPYRLRISPDQSDVQSAFKHAERRLAAAPLAPTGTLQTNPGRRFRLERPPEESVAEQSVASGTRVTALEGGVSGDALLVSLDQGASWSRIDWDASQAGRDRHWIDSTRVFVDGDRLLVAPQARAPDAALELLSFDLAGGPGTALPFPRPTGAPWRCEISDLRRNAAGLEALVLVHDPRLRRGPEQPAAASWASRLRLAGERWQELERIPMPGDARALRLRFSESGDDLLLVHDRKLLARREAPAH